jgi:hypothetical protein
MRSPFAKKLSRASLRSGSDGLRICTSLCKYRCEACEIRRCVTQPSLRSIKEKLILRGIRPQKIYLPHPCGRDSNITRFPRDFAALLALVQVATCAIVARRSKKATFHICLIIIGHAPNLPKIVEKRLMAEQNGHPR